MLLKEATSKTACLKTFLGFLCVVVACVSIVHSAEGPVSRDLHWAVTDEKFELALERMRAGEKAVRRTPVVLSHGFLVNSVFFNLDEEQSVARYLAREGFDVWNLSLRGSGRSLNPLRGGPKVWSLDDMIERDVPAVIRYIQKETGSPKVFWLGYELGGLLAYGHLEKKQGAGLAGAVTLAAPVTFGHSKQEVMKKLLYLEESPFSRKLFFYLNVPFLGRLLIPLVPKIEKLFYNPENMDDETKQMLLERALTEINPGVLDHLLLMIKRGEFVSATGNYSYRKNLNRIRAPLLLIGGEADPLAPAESIREVYRASGSADRTVRIFGPKAKDSAAYGHFDLIVGKKSQEEVFSLIAEWLKQRDGQR